MKLTDAQWAVLEVLWSGEWFSLGDVTRQLQAINGWSRNTVHTYLTRMEERGLVCIDRSRPEPYRAAVSRDDCARQERKDLLTKVYGGAAGDLIAAFLKDSHLTETEAARLRRLLDEMEV